MHAMDLANGVDYAVGSVTNSGFGKIVEVNPQHKHYVILGVSGYNGAYNNRNAEVDARNAEYGNRPDGTPYVNPQNVCPARIYIGMKGKMEDGKQIICFFFPSEHIGRKVCAEITHSTISSFILYIQDLMRQLMTSLQEMVFVTERFMDLLLI